VSRADLERYEPGWSRPAELDWVGHRFLTRAGLSGVPETLGRLPPLRDLDATARVHALLDALEGPGAEGHTTNLVTADSDGNACVFTSSLGLGTGDFLPGLDLQLNSMLGEVDLVLEPLQPGDRMHSMMAPSLALDAGRLALAIGSAGGTRLRTALVGVAAGVLDEGLEPARPSGARASTAPATSSTRSPAWTSRLSRSSRRQGFRSGAGPPAPLLRRRQPDRASRRCGDPRRSGHAATVP
jgi:gamma-glutamyltranspeptidase/glutathione hydrolase